MTTDPSAFPSYHERLVAFIDESNRIEGIRRDPLPREIDAHGAFLALNKIELNDLVKFVADIEPEARLRNRPDMAVQVGGYRPPDGGKEITLGLRYLLHKANQPITHSLKLKRGQIAFNLHHEYETLHPFTDGNGRSGRVLWLWMMGGWDKVPLGFLHTWYHQSLSEGR